MSKKPGQYASPAALLAATAEMLADALEEVMQGKQLPRRAAEYLEARRVRMSERREPPM